MISGVPLLKTTPCTTPLVVVCESTWSDTVLPTRPFACIIASEVDDCVGATRNLSFSAEELSAIEAILAS